MTTLLRQVGRTNVYRVVDTVPATTQNYIVSLAPGTYKIGIIVRSNVTGTTTTLGNFRALLSPEGDAVGASAANDLPTLRPQDSALGNVSVALPAGDTGIDFFLASSEAFASVTRPIGMLVGFQFTLTKGGAATGEKCEVSVVATRVG